MFIPPDEINGAMQGDQVLVELAPPRGDGRRLGRIARVLERRNSTVVGTFHYAKGRTQAGVPGDRSSSTGWKSNYVVPFDERMTQSILIPQAARFRRRQTWPRRIAFSARRPAKPHRMRISKA